MYDSGYQEQPTGFTLFWRKNEVGARVYHSDEVGGGSLVWDTTFTSMEMLLAAILQEQYLQFREREEKRIQLEKNKNKNDDNF